MKPKNFFILRLFVGLLIGIMIGVALQSLTQKEPQLTTKSQKMNEKISRNDFYGEILEKKTDSLLIAWHILPPVQDEKVEVDTSRYYSFDLHNKNFIFIHEKKLPDGTFTSERGSFDEIKVGNFIHRIVFQSETTTNILNVELRYSEQNPFSS